MYLLKKVWDGLIIWLDTNGIKETEYQFGCFNGPNSIKILNKALQLKDILPIELKKFADALNLLNEVRIHCFGQKLLPNYENKIKLFEKAYKKLNISVTPKAHALFQHCAEFCLEYGEGLGAFSEQSGETLHSDFLICWARYKRDQSHPEYCKQLLAAVVSYNSLHI